MHYVISQSFPILMHYVISQSFPILMHYVISQSFVNPLVWGPL